MNKKIVQELIASRTDEVLRDEHKSLMAAARRRPSELKVSQELSDADSGFYAFCRIAKDKGFELGARWTIVDGRFVNGSIFVDADSLAFAVSETIRLPYSARGCKKEIPNRRCDVCGITLSIRGWSLLLDIPMREIYEMLEDGKTMDEIAETMNCGSLLFNGVEMLEKGALKAAGVLLSWFSKRKHDEEKLIGRSLRQNEKQKLFERLVAEGREFRELGFLEMFGAGWLRVDKDDLGRLKSAATEKGVSVGSYLHDLINASK